MLLIKILIINIINSIIINSNIYYKSISNKKKYYSYIVINK